MRDKGYTFMDSDAAGNAIWTFPVVLSLFCWNLILGLISLLAIYCVAVFLLWKYRNVFRIDVGRIVFIGLCTLLTVLVAEAFYAVYLSDSVSEIYQFVIYTFTLVFIISFKMLNAGMGNKFEFDKEIIMIPISDILIRSISGYVFMVPVFVLYFLWLKKLGRTQSFLHTAAVFVFGYYLFGLLTVTGIGFTSTMTFRPNISWTPFIGMITGPIDTILNIILFVPLGFFLPLLYKKYHHMKTVALTGFLFSLAVEIVQMFGWGSSDINDLMTNTAGACIGFLVYCLLSRILPANLKKQLQSSRVNAVAEVLLFAICTFAIMVTAQTWFVHDVLNVP